MAKPTRSAIQWELLERHGTTYARELRADVARGTPSALFKLLVGAILLSARIGARQGHQGGQRAVRPGLDDRPQAGGHHFADRRVLDEARRLGLPGDARALARGHDRQGVRPAGGRASPLPARQGPQRDPGDGRKVTRATPRPQATVRVTSMLPRVALE